MASPRGKACRAALCLLGGLALRPALGDVKTLLDEGFAGRELGSRPGPWLYFVDPGNVIAIAQSPSPDGVAPAVRCLRLSRSGGTIWMPMFCGWAAGEPGSPVRLDFDWYLPQLSDGPDHVLFVTLRGTGNINLITVALGGPGGIAVPQDGDTFVPLGFPLRPSRWGHLTIVADPLARKTAGAFDVAISQGKEHAEYPNIAFRPDWRGVFPDALEYSPTFHVGGGSPDRPRQAYVTNVRLTTTSPREYR